MILGDLERRDAVVNAKVVLDREVWRQRGDFEGKERRMGMRLRKKEERRVVRFVSNVDGRQRVDVEENGNG